MSGSGHLAVQEFDADGALVRRQLVDGVTHKVIAARLGVSRQLITKINHSRVQGEN